LSRGLLQGTNAVTPRYPHIVVALTGHDGNAFVILDRCRKAARDAGLSDDEIAAFVAEAMKKDYDHLLRTAMGWFEVV
jgi:hypothetical protein